jgi:transcriptional regulator with XRE-family HTH domain
MKVMMACCTGMGFMFMLDLKSWRKAHALTQTQAAKALAISERHYRKLETGNAPINRRIALLVERIGL